MENVVSVPVRADPNLNLDYPWDSPMIAYKLSGVSKGIARLVQ